MLGTYLIMIRWGGKFDMGKILVAMALVGMGVFIMFVSLVLPLYLQNYERLIVTIVGLAFVVGGMGEAIADD